MQWFQGEPVLVTFPANRGLDDFNEAVTSYPDAGSVSAADWGELAESGVWQRVMSGELDLSEAVPTGVLAVDNVVIAPLTPDEMSYLGDPRGYREGYKLYMPRGFDAPLRKAHVIVYGGEYEVRGRPHPYQETMMAPDFEWNLVVEVVAFDG